MNVISLVSGTALAFSPNWWFFSTMRFFMGFGNIAFNIILYVIGEKGHKAFILTYTRVALTDRPHITDNIPTLGPQQTSNRPTANRQQTNNRPSTDQHLTVHRPTTDRQHTHIRPSADQQQTDDRPSTDQQQTVHRPNNRPTTYPH